MLCVWTRKIAGIHSKAEETQDLNMTKSFTCKPLEDQFVHETISHSKVLCSSISFPNIFLFTV